MSYTSLWKLTAVMGLVWFSAGILPLSANNERGDKSISIETKAVSEEVLLNKKDEKGKKFLSGIGGQPLDDTDFILSEVNFGDSPDKVIDLNGVPDSVIHGTISDEYHWAKSGLTVVVNRKLPYDYSQRTDLNFTNKISFSGTSLLYVEGKSAVTKRGISVGSFRENVLRTYGRPMTVLWDGPNQSFHLLYVLGEKEISFIIKEDKVKAFQFAIRRKKSEVQKYASEFIHSRESFSQEDFKIAGFHLDTTFKAHPWDAWQRKLSNSKEDVWYLSGYAVRTTAKSEMIQGLFLTDSNMITTRGVTLGDDLETVELVYGAPHKVEIDVSSGHPRTSYIYFSKNKKNILIIFIEKQKVDGIISTKNPQFADKK